MKTLVLFIDMVRPSHLGKLHLKSTLPIERFLGRMNGTHYLNCHTPSPDTTRSMACFWSGSPPQLNGCNTRIKWPRFFLDSNLGNIYEDLSKAGVRMNFFHEPNEVEVGVLPLGAEKYAYASYDLKSFLELCASDRAQENIFNYIGLSDFHLQFNSYGYDIDGVIDSHEILEAPLKLVESHIADIKYDHVIVFSDHGYLIQEEMSKPEIYLSEIRSNILLFHHKRGDDTIVKSDKFCSIMSIRPFIAGLFNIKRDLQYDAPFNEAKERDYILLEDHQSYQPRIRHNIDYWGVRYNKALYARTITRRFLDGKEIQANDSFAVEGDRILREYTDLLSYENEYDALLRHKVWMNKERSGAISALSDGSPRRKRSFVSRILRAVRSRCM